MIFRVQQTLTDNIELRINVIRLYFGGMVTACEKFEK